MASGVAGRHEAQQPFLFMDSWAPDKAGRNGRRNARSFLMQNARRQRPWSTSKAATGKQRRATGDACSAVPATSSGVYKSRTKKTATAPTIRSQAPNSAEESIIHPTMEETRTAPADMHLVEDDAALCGSCKTERSMKPGWLCWGCNELHGNQQNSLETIGSGGSDPFGTLPVEMSPTSMNVLSHFMSMMAPGSIPIDIHRKSDVLRSIWFKTALASEACLHSVLAGAAGHLYVLGVVNYATIVHHKAKTVAAVNNSLCDPTLGLLDSNIAAVFSLLCIEEMIRPAFVAADEAEYIEGARQRSIHLDGLLRMIQLRGGLINLRSNPVVQSFILWHATQHAVASFDPPYVTIEESDGTIPRYPSSSDVYEAAWASQMTSWCRDLEIGPELLDIVIDSQMYTTDLNSWYENYDSRFDALDLQNQSCLLQARLLRWLDSHDLRFEETNHFGSSHHLWEEALCIALLMFISRVSRTDVAPSFDPLHYTAVERLRVAVTRIIEQSHRDFKSYDSVMSLSHWIMAIGGITSQDDDSESFFMQTCATFIVYPQNSHGPSSLSTFVNRLQEFMWVGFKLDLAAKRLWESMMGQRSYTGAPSPPFQKQVLDLPLRIASESFSSSPRSTTASLAPQPQQHQSDEQPQPLGAEPRRVKFAFAPGSGTVAHDTNTWARNEIRQNMGKGTGGDESGDGQPEFRCRICGRCEKHARGPGCWVIVSGRP